MNKNEILDRTNAGLDIFRYYISKPFSLNRNFRNPLYNDKNASCSIYYDRRKGVYRMKDFGNNAYSGDCFFFVGKFLNLDCNRADDFKEILKQIESDLFLNSSPETLPQKQVIPSREQQLEKSFSCEETLLSSSQLTWWAQYGIKVETLDKYGVVSLLWYESINREGKLFRLRTSESNPIYAFKDERHIKVYRPFSRFRFLQAGTMPTVYCFGWKQLPRKADLVFITGGEKDVLSLASHGFCAIAFNSETSNIPKEIIKNLTLRFRHIVLLYDVDQTGLDSADKQEKHLAEYGVLKLRLPLAGNKKQKDISDFFRLGNTAGDLMNLFSQILELRYSQSLTTLQMCEVDLNHPPSESKAIISANGVPLGTQGNLLCITGAEGTGKSNYTSALLAGAIGKLETDIDCLGIDVERNIKHKAVLLYDTEQSEMQLFCNVERLLKRAEVINKPNFFHAFSMSGVPRNERLVCIEQSIDKYYYQHRGIQLVVIDGIADLIASTNDENESIALVEKLHRLAGLYNTCIIAVLHFIPSGIKLRGHLGSELQRKVASILAIDLERDKRNSVVKAIKVREGSPLDVPLMLFSWDRTLERHVYRGEKPEQNAKARKREVLWEALKNIFSEQSSYSYTNLSKALQVHFDVKERTAKEYIRFMFDQQMMHYVQAGKREIILMKEYCKDEHK